MTTVQPATDEQIRALLSSGNPTARLNAQSALNGDDDARAWCDAYWYWAGLQETSP